ncbi:response regulator [Roseibium sp. RKSG952]|uniref:response regulator n=1 Tax=Roseibium sp. RKSG952 TaxID=2529384 RepID=UPI0012BC360C|nr:response regulator [Roseibium sp. RKSG952]MTH96797.1 response regulator [Roseibium sp. RKSG952]
MKLQWDLSGVSFLVVEDNSHMRSILRSVLSGLGVRVIYEAADGFQALERVLDRQPDVILVDWMMSPLSGAEFVRILRAEKDPVISTTPVIVVSAHARRATVLEAIKLGIHGFVAKPISPAALYTRIVEVLQRQERDGRSKGFAGGGRKRPSALAPRHEASTAEGQPSPARKAKVFARISN